MPSSVKAHSGPRARRGDLAARLLDVAVQIVAEEGPEAMSLREVQRRTGVSAAAAYRHYRDRDALLLAVGQRASAQLADYLQAAVDSPGTPGVSDSPRTAQRDASTASARLRRGCLAYLAFSAHAPNLFRAVFLTGERPEQLQDPEPNSLGATGRGPYQILQDCLASLVETGEMQAQDLPWSDTAIWAATHGLAILTIDGPLRHLAPRERTAAAERLLDIILLGLTTRTRHH